MSVGAQQTAVRPQQQSRDLGRQRHPTGADAPSAPVYAQIGKVFGVACGVNPTALYIADSDNLVIRTLDVNGNISTLWFGFYFSHRAGLDRQQVCERAKHPPRR
jgi:hypothetical protein